MFTINTRCYSMSKVFFSFISQFSFKINAPYCGYPVTVCSKKAMALPYSCTACWIFSCLHEYILCTIYMYFAYTSTKHVFFFALAFITRPFFNVLFYRSFLRKKTMIFVALFDVHHVALRALVPHFKKESAPIDSNILLCEPSGAKGACFKPAPR